MFNILFSIAFMLNIGPHANLCKTFCKQDAKYLEKRLADQVILKIDGDTYPMSKYHATNFLNNLSKCPPPFVSAKVEKIKNRKSKHVLVPGKKIKYKFKIVYEFYDGREVIKKFMYVDMKDGKIVGLHTSY